MDVDRDDVESNKDPISAKNATAITSGTMICRCALRTARRGAVIARVTDIGRAFGL
jgi:hypothetical protein